MIGERELVQNERFHAAKALVIGSKAELMEVSQDDFEKHLRRAISAFIRYTIVTPSLHHRYISGEPSAPTTLRTAGPSSSLRPNSFETHRRLRRSCSPASLSISASPAGRAVCTTRRFGHRLHRRQRSCRRPAFRSRS